MSSNGCLLRVTNVSKCYHLYDKKHHRLLQLLLGHQRSFYKEFWALRDITFNLNTGESLGIVGRNGSGKSTLLQIIAGIMRPTLGNSHSQGRISALLELGSGFNPEFTGRENVFMNGALFGFSKKEIEAKFDEIEDFAEIGDFIDQPIKRYSSGMRVRLAYAVHALSDPDCLIVDEALSVGDAVFQIKCMSHMQKLIDRGTTILFVSHSVNNIRTFCERALWLEAGRMKAIGSAEEVTNRYMESLFSGSADSPSSTKTIDPSMLEEATIDGAMLPVDYPGRTSPVRRWGDGEIEITTFSMVGSKTGPTPFFEYLESIRISFCANVQGRIDADAVSVAFALRDSRGIDVIAVSSSHHNVIWTDLNIGDSLKGNFEYTNPLVPADYILILAIEYMVQGKRTYADYIENLFPFTVISDRRHYGIVEPKITISVT
ncbi:MAG: ABC transporter ATP-binding protein [Cyanobacteria bacterium HKST-UBA02]|nr:ABC transporter ATP-binding protein [Cyanobacteria bacterium HKST-UBA02]